MAKQPVQPFSLDKIEGLPVVGDGSGLAADDRFYSEEVKFALRNRGMPLEALRYPMTPTGLHYLVVHFDIPEVTPDDWRLTIGGQVVRPLHLTLSDLQSRPAVTIPVTMECAGNGRALLSPRPTSQPWGVEGVSTVEWTGASLRGVLQDAGLSDRTTEIVFTGLDWGVQGGVVQAYQRSLALEEAMRDEVLLAYAMNGAPLPPQHGYPLRLLVPGWYGMASVKWLTMIEAISEPFTGYQMTKSYRYSREAEDPGEPVMLIKPRALMIPPGFPDFATRVRIVNAGSVLLRGRAWAGRFGITRVEVSTDSGSSWIDADLDHPISDFAWRGWSYMWDAPPGRYTLCARATCTTGAVQPTEQFWTYQGMGNNTVQAVDVLVV
jgi:DMSO/TMAO reductase YedYZ molybdopterin-dependent catalytic subunit